jgi:hypothetical protein
MYLQHDSNKKKKIGLLEMKKIINSSIVFDSSGRMRKIAEAIIQKATERPNRRQPGTSGSHL